MWLIYLVILALLIPPALAGSDDDDDELVTQEFALRVGHGVKIGDYRVELISVQSVRDGLIEVRVWKRISDVEEWRVVQEHRESNFDGGSERGGITLNVIEIFDEESVSIAAEYREDYGFPRSYITERGKAPKNYPQLEVVKSVDRSDISVGDEVTVTIKVENTGNDTASDVAIFESPPMSQFRYLSGYPPKIKNELRPGESDFAVYTIVAETESEVEVPVVVINYVDDEQNMYTASSGTFDIAIRSKRKPELDLRVDQVSSIKHGGLGFVNVTVLNRGDASAYRIEIHGDISPSDGGIEVVGGGLDKSFFDIPPQKSETYSATVKGTRSGSYLITLKVDYEDEDEIVMQKEASVQAVVLEREYKYLYYVPIIPALVIAVWIFRRYKEYKY